MVFFTVLDFVGIWGTYTYRAAFPNLTNVAWCVLLLLLEWWIFQEVASFQASMSWSNDPVTKTLDKILFVHTGIVIFAVLSFSLSVYAACRVFANHPFSNDSPALPLYENLACLLLWGLLSWWASSPNVRSSNANLDTANIRNATRRSQVVTGLTPHPVTPLVTPEPSPRPSHFISNPLADAGVDETSLDQHPLDLSLDTTDTNPRFIVGILEETQEE
jgi:hypothetical protein